MRKVSYIFGVILLLLVALTGPIKHTPLTERPHYELMMQSLRDFQPEPFPATGTLKAGWTKVNITPEYSMPLAGYRPRDGFDEVRDSLFVRIIAVNNGSGTAFFITADLLLFPPELRTQVLASIPENSFVYFGATHTHHGLGGWDSSLAGRWVTGTYHPDWVLSTAEKIKRAMETCQNSLSAVQIIYTESDASEMVENRLDPASIYKDGIIRTVNFVKADGRKAKLMTFSGHPTTLPSRERLVSNDYPGAWAQLESKMDTDFPMFMAGMVGSHRIKGKKEDAFTDNTASKINRLMMNSAVQDTISSHYMAWGRLTVAHGPSQLRIMKSWKLRDWVFKWVFDGPLEGEITYLKIGNILFLGTPGDFSGELWSRNEWDRWYALTGKRVVITSFNGYFTGYITHDSHYKNSKKEEVRTMNWVGPEFGAYYALILESLVKKEASEN